MSFIEHFDARKADRYPSLGSRSLIDNMQERYLGGMPIKTIEMWLASMMFSFHG